MEFKALKFPCYLGVSGWNALLPEQKYFPALDHDTQADFVIIGAGFAGLAAARRLRELEPDADIVLLEAGHIAQGASGRNSGFMIDLPHELTSDDYAGSGDDKAIIKLNRQAQSFADKAVDEYGIDVNYFDRAGKINGAASHKAHAYNGSYANHLTGLGEVYEKLDAKQMHEITGSQHYLSGIFTPGTVMLQPAGFVRGMAKGLGASGVDIYENSPVTAFRKTGQVWTVITPGGEIRAKNILLTVNGHLESFGIKRNRLMQIFLFAMMTEELNEDALSKLGGHSRWGVTPSDPMGTTMRRIDTGQGGNRIITRTCSVMRSNLKASLPDLARAQTVMRKKFDQRFPQLAGMKMDYAWAGHLCLSRNHVAVMGEIEQGVYSACVQNGLGTARGTLTGMGAAELACGVTSDITDYFTQEEEPQKLPPRPFRDLGANAYMRYKEWQAREE